MIENIQAIGQHIFVIRDAAADEKGGFAVTEWSQQANRPNTGKILSVGTDILDKKVKKDLTAIFAKKIGFEIEIDNTIITVINYNQLLGTI